MFLINSYSGTINGDNTAKTLSLSLDSSSKLILTGDTYLTSLKNEVSDNSNINLNGHKLYVNGEAINVTSYKEDDINNNAVQNETDNKNNQQLLIILISIGVLIAAIILIILISKRKRK